MLSEQQLRDMVGDEAFDAIPNRQRREPKPKAVGDVLSIPNSQPRQSKPKVVLPSLFPPEPRKQRRQRSVRNQQRQRIVLGGLVPAKIAAGFTLGETAVMTVLAVEHNRHRCCELSIQEIGKRAGCCRTVVKNAIHWAEHWGIIKVERRKVAQARNAPNVIRIVNPLWIAWLKLGPARPRPWGGGGVISETGGPVQGKKERGSMDFQGEERARNGHWRGIPGRGWKGATLDSPYQRASLSQRRGF